MKEDNFIVVLRSISYSLYIILGIVPFAILRYYPFLNKLRIKNTYFWITFASIVVFETIWFIGIKENGHMLGVYSSEFVRMSFYGVYFILSCIVIKEKFARHMFVWCIIIIFSSTITAFTRLIGTLITSKVPYLTNNIAMLIILPVSIILGFKFIKGVVIPVIYETSYYVCKLITVLLANLFILGVICACELPMNQIEPIAVLGVRCIIAICGVTICLIFRGNMQDQQKIFLLREEKQRQEALLAMSKEQFLALSEKIEKAKRGWHDLKHHLAAVQNYIARKDYDGLSQYIEKASQILPPDTILTFCNNQTTNVILSYYYDKSQKSEIPMDIRVNMSKEVSIPEAELWVLLGNLLENALEGSLRIKEGKRKVKVKIALREGILAIVIDNCCNENTIRIVEQGFQSSKDDLNCGNGLASISLLAEKYAGNATFEVKDGWFQSSVYLQV